MRAENQLSVALEDPHDLVAGSGVARLETAQRAAGAEDDPAIGVGLMFLHARARRYLLPAAGNPADSLHAPLGWDASRVRSGAERERGNDDDANRRGDSKCVAVKKHARSWYLCFGGGATILRGRAYAKQAIWDETIGESDP